MASRISPEEGWRLPVTDNRCWRQDILAGGKRDGLQGGSKRLRGKIIGSDVADLRPRRRRDQGTGD
ncbi:hypothetical protein Q4F19_17060 [Sphingomonas sp. BIUV-7]|uniref:Uncharacterized protein n=1 Tax=Sphingomonas natans TaxID=3063330 RepID=A0ABT8YE89_9SPHN|nr:hypothetical protein [Sphingomonas sp. BIUV-7]